MFRKIKLYSNFGKYLGDKELLKNGEKLTITIDYILPKNCRLFFIANNGLEERKGDVVNNQIIFDCDYLTEGSLSLTLNLISDNQIVKRFKVEDLIIRNIPNGFENIPEIVELKQRQVELEKYVKEMTSKIELLLKLWKGEI